MEAPRLAGGIGSRAASFRERSWKSKKIRLCSDGLTEKVSDDRLLECAQQMADVRQCAEALGKLALDAGSRDNISCIVVEVVRKPGKQRPPGD